MSIIGAIELSVTILFLILVTAVLVFYGAMIRSLFRDAPFVPSPRKVAEAMMNLAEVKSDERLVDLGSGWGDILMAAARRGARSRGYEQSLILSFLAWLRWRFFLPQADVRTVRGNLFEANLADVEVVTCYLYSKAMERLRVKFEAELKLGARVVSVTFPIHGWTPAQVIHIANRPIFLYYIESEKNPS